jgi:ABC-type glycerol-3-phosphate transport system substrate-binding protein
MSKRWFLLSLALLMALAFSMFSVPAAPTNAQDPTATPTTPPAVPTATPAISELGSGGTHLAFWNGLTGSDGVTLNAMLTQFVKEHPEISVTTEIIPWQTLYTKLQTAFVAGQPPDVFLLHASEIPQFASYGVLKDLSSWYADAGGWLPKDDVSKATLNGITYKGVIYGIPLDNHGRGLWINDGAFKKAGLDPNMTPPTTYEGWVDLFQKLTLDKNGKNAADPAFDSKNVAQWGYAVGEWPFVNWYSVLMQNGGTVVSEDGKKITVNSDAGVKALQQAVDLVYKYHVSPPSTGFDSWAAFAAGNLAIVPTGTWFRNYAATLTDIKSRAWPQLQWGPKKGTWFGAHTFMVPVNQEGEKLKAVETLIRWVSEHQVDWAASGQVPARLSAQKALDPDHYPTNILLGKTFTEYGFTDFQSVAYQELAASALGPELDAALNGQKTAKQALDDAASRMQQILDRAASGG